MRSHPCTVCLCEMCPRVVCLRPKTRPGTSTSPRRVTRGRATAPPGSHACPTKRRCTSSWVPRPATAFAPLVSFAFRDLPLRPPRVPRAAQVSPQHDAGSIAALEFRNTKPLAAGLDFWFDRCVMNEQHQTLGRITTTDFSKRLCDFVTCRERV
jgi:hypothetical protein